ncbi:superoxide dismutase [Fe]-like [Schistocerca gregaria]|uniref:superoxide dismutase [Fe]-like n=1 Tax=Schistocerca gregaria TaxID=7010 RepID=UPI00211F2144|nr:superoxide dismutase [Fe]-like [Schistocerca gregaria]
MLIQKVAFKQIKLLPKDIKFRSASSANSPDSKSGPFFLDPLPYPKSALCPHISEETLEYHYGKHHANYVSKLNSLIKGTELEKKSLVELITTQKGGVYNNAAQAWNHSFYWNSMSPQGGGDPKGPLSQCISKCFGSFDEFKKKFDDESLNHFGSGWTWLVRNEAGELKIMTTHDAGNPICNGYTPILTCDLWEHAYYIDHRNARPKYMENWWKLVNWKFAGRNFEKSN